jgi:hypothetical protein
MPDDPYRVLGVRPDADPDVIRRAYLQLARRHHPDFFVDASPGERAAAEARMRAVNEAWAVLGDRQRRAAHDDAAPRGFQPFDVSLDDDELDPRDQPDIPYRPAPPPTARRQLTTLAPVLLFGASVTSVVLAMVTGAAAALGLALLLLVLSAAGFLLLPLLALGQAKRDEG